MKKGIIILFVALECVLSSCNERFGHKYLDGMWQVQKMTYADGVTQPVEDMYFSFQIDIMEVRKPGLGSACIYNYADGVMSFDFNGMSEEQAHAFGMSGSKSTFVVEKLNSDKLILRSDYARVELRKY